MATFPPNVKYQDLFLALEREARENNRGLWGEELVPKDPPPNEDSDTVYVTEAGKKYHRSSCHHLNKSCISISRKDAIARGYTPCSVCKP